MNPLRYPEDISGVVELGHRHFLFGPTPSGEYLWYHDCPKSLAWSWFGAKADGTKSGHGIVSTSPLTVTGSLLCPQGCGDHGYIEEGRWRIA